MTNSVAQLCKRLERARERSVESEEDNHVEFHNTKDEAIAFIRKMKPELKRSIAEARITVRRPTMRFSMEPTRWLAVYHNTGLQFRDNKNLTLEKVGKAKDRVRHLAATRGLPPGVVERIQVVAVQAVAL